jgi:hypothetical protein
MKILYVANFDLPDFMSDMIFHGARTILGADVVDSREAWYMYDDMRLYWNQRVPENGLSYGRGFTLYGRLPKLDVDRTDIEGKIKKHYFDKVIYGSISRNQDYLPLVYENYTRSDIIMIDGEDNQENQREKYGNVGKYYKREYLKSDSETFPINFCIPRELIVPRVPEKSQDWGTVMPGHPNTYVYREEKPYFEDYQKSYIALTKSKGGWDCLRHYEILMNGCIPYFPYLENCPELTMTRFPKKLILETNKKIDDEENLLSFYEEYVNLLLEHTRKNLTTDVVVKNIIST